MYEVEVLNLITNKQFTKTFETEYSMRLFVGKCRYSKKVKVISIWKR